MSEAGSRKFIILKKLASSISHLPNLSIRSKRLLTIVDSLLLEKIESISFDMNSER